MTDWRWVGSDVVYAIHDRQLAEHGGLDGVRDAGAVESALARPQNLAAYGEPDVADLAAAYAYGLASNHAFNDANKRTAWACCVLFLKVNGVELDTPAAIVVERMPLLAAGQLGEADFAVWLRDCRRA